jgi:hypothetical protein
MQKDWHIGSPVSQYVVLYQNIHSKTLGTTREYEAKKVKNTMNQFYFFIEKNQYK